MKRICVFCGSSPGRGTAYLEAARCLGRVLVEQGLELVFGGSGVGLMGELARTVRAGGGTVIGVMPSGLFEKGLALEGLADLRVVATMHERKALMADLACGFVALPGGMGTLEELLEALTWTQLGLHRKPCGMLNTGGYFDHLLTFLDTAERESFIRPEHRAMVLVDDDPASLLGLLADYQHPEVDKVKWIRQLSRDSRS